MRLRSITVIAALAMSATAGASAAERPASPYGGASGNPAFSAPWAKRPATPAPAPKLRRSGVSKETLPDGRVQWKTDDTTVTVSGFVEGGVTIGGGR